MLKNSWIVISLGGSIIVPNQIDTVFLKEFRKFIVSFKNNRFVIICGGGETNRQYNKAARDLGHPSNNDLDWIGIRTLTLNAELVRTMFSKVAYKEVVLNPDQLKKLPSEKIIVGAAYEPGHSSDWDAVLWAKKLGAKQIINLSNIEQVYTADPNKDKSAKPINDMNWSNYLKIIGTKWSPRLSTPFDPTAAKLANKLKVKVYILNGRKLINVKKAIHDKKFIGTILHS